MIAIRRPVEPPEPADRYRLLRAVFIGLAIEAGIAGLCVAVYYACKHTWR